MAIMNNYLNGSFCKVEIRDARERELVGGKLDGLLIEEFLLRWPNGNEEWLPSEVVDGLAEPGFRDVTKDFPVGWAS